MTPSSWASKSTVALSVSTSQRGCHPINSSPSLLFHLAIVPASIVGDRLGIPTTSWGG